MNLSGAMDCLRVQWGLNALAPDTQGCYGVRFDGLPVTFAPRGDGHVFIARSRLGAVDAQDVETLVALMARNFLPPDPYAGTLGIDAEGAVFLTLCLRGDRLAPVHFTRALEHFVARAQAVAADLAGHAAGGNDKPAHQESDLAA